MSIFQRALKGLECPSLPADETDSVRTKRLLALSALFRWAFFHLMRSSLMNWPFLPSVPCSRSPTYSSISSAFSMDRMYLDSRRETWMFLFIDRYIDEGETEHSFLPVCLTVLRYLCSVMMSCVIVNNMETFCIEFAKPGVNSDALCATADRPHFDNLKSKLHTGRSKPNRKRLSQWLAAQQNTVQVIC